MRGTAIVVLLGSVACATGQAATSGKAPSELKEWQTPAGEPLAKNEFAAVVATCEDRVRVKRADQAGTLERCLADYGRVQ